jgi:hypothetical protein
MQALLMHWFLLIIRAYKRLQLNYYMSDNYLPSVDPALVPYAAELCQNISAFTGNTHDCTTFDYLFSCLAIPSDWKYVSGGVYMPYAWVEESVVFDEDTANSIKDISAAIAFAYDVQLWCFVSGGVFYFTICPVFL